MPVRDLQAGVAVIVPAVAVHAHLDVRPFANASRADADRTIPPKKCESASRRSRVFVTRRTYRSFEK